MKKEAVCDRVHRRKQAYAKYAYPAEFDIFLESPRPSQQMCSDKMVLGSDIATRCRVSLAISIAPSSHTMILRCCTASEIHGGNCRSRNHINAIHEERSL